MKLPAFALFLLLWSAASSGQTFAPLPGPVLDKQVAFEQANECYIFFDNPSGDTLQLRWRSFTLSYPPDWVIDLCDYGLCYTGIPPNGTMNPVFDTIQPYLKLIVQPGTTAGSAWLWFRVFEKDNDENFRDVYFSLYTPGTSGAGEAGLPETQVFPNPASEVLFIENKALKRHNFQLFNTQGQQVWQQQILPGGQIVLDVRTFSNGLYFLQAPGQRTQPVLIQK